MKPSPNEDRVLREWAADGLEEAVAWHTVGIVEQGSDGIGTGTAVNWRGSTYVLTAWHVISRVKAGDLCFLFRPNGTLERHIADDLAPGAPIPLIPREQINIIDVHSDEDKDLAALRLPPSIEGRHNVTFHVINPDARRPRFGQTVVYMGFPSELGFRVHGRGYAAFRSVEWSTVHKNQQHLRDFNPKDCFLIEYQSAEKGRHPRGFSGAGVWYRKGKTKGVWHPNLELGGICVNYHRQKGLLEVVRMETIRAFLDSL